MVGLTGFEPATPLHPMQVRYQTALQPDELGPTGVVSRDGEVYIGKL